MKFALSEVSRKSSSKVNFYCFSENGFQVIQSGASVLGIAYNPKQAPHGRAVLENLDSGECLFFDFQHSENISNLIVNEELGTVLSAGFDKVLTQYSLRTGQVTKRYGDLGIYDIQSAASSGRVAVVGGQTEVRFINMLKKEVIHMNYMPTDSIYVYTLEFGRSGDRTVMICAGDSAKANLYQLGEVINNSILFVPKGCRERANRSGPCADFEFE